MNPGLPNEIEVTGFSHHTANPTRKLKHALEVFGIRGYIDMIVRAFRTFLVGTRVIDELSFISGKETQLQSPLRCVEKYIFLWNDFHRLVTQCFRSVTDGCKISGIGFDFNIRWHSLILPCSREAKPIDISASVKGESL